MHYKCIAFQGLLKHNIEELKSCDRPCFRWLPGKTTVNLAQKADSVHVVLLSVRYLNFAS